VVSVSHDFRGGGLDLIEGLAGYLTERVLLIRANGTIVASLGRSPGMLGYGAGEREGMHIAERVHADDLPGVLQLFERARFEWVNGEVRLSEIGSAEMDLRTHFLGGEEGPGGPMP